MTLTDKNLAKKPLVEAIWEIRWRAPSTGLPLPSVEGGARHLMPMPGGLSFPVGVVDPHYQITLPRLVERIRERYPVYESLPAASLPEDIAPHQVQHRFRFTDAGWPLLQFGPGVLTAHETSAYSWGGFREQCSFAIKALSTSHPAMDSIKFDNIALRYINAIEFDPKNDRLFAFLKEKLKLGIDIPDLMFGDRVEKKISAFNCLFEFSNKQPVGRININLQMAQRDEMPIILWTLSLYSAGADVPQKIELFDRWVESAHESIEDWFFKTIDGELRRRFTNA